MSIFIKDIRIDSLTITLNSNDLIIFGSSVELQCMSVNSSSQSSWYWFSENNLLFIDGHGEQNINKSKYIEQQINDVTRRLTIFHFEETDLKMYRCKHNLKSASINLTAQRHKIAYMNNSSNLNIRLERQRNEDHIVISFVNTSSTPSCHYQSLNVTLNITLCNTLESGVLHNGMCQFVINSPKTCTSKKSSAEVLCYLGNKLFKTLKYTACHKPDVEEKPNVALISILFVIGTVGGIVILVFVINRRDKLLKERDEDPRKNHQKDSSSIIDVTSKFLETDPD
ncbi:Hypothetical predicted protein [Mytilus galloprovincialis]|nr:Hypothetical predicted protein [Mytilus galloprovincialis]